MRTNTKAEQTFTHEGGQAHRTSPENELKRSVMSCMLWEDTFYENGTDIATRIRELSARCTPEFVSDLARKAKHEGHLRHAPMWLASGLTSLQGPLVGKTITDVITRADEMSEMLAMYWKNGKRPLSKQLKLGLAEAFKKFDEYQFAKYDRKNEIRLRDVMFLVHPKPDTPEQEQLFKKIANQELSTPDTWEVRLSRGDDKKQSFEELLDNKKLGYLALLRNLRNMEGADVPEEKIRSAILDRRSGTKILPFQFIAAAKAAPKYERELDLAMQTAMLEMPKLKGKTVLLVDVSGSMEWGYHSNQSKLTNLDRACGLAILLAGVAETLEVFTFSSQVVYVPPRQGMALADAIRNSQYHGGTRLGEAVKAVDQKVPYDRLIVITDEQSHDRVPNPKGTGYAINVASYKNGVTYGPWKHIDGFSEKIVDWIQEFEQ